MTGKNTLAGNQLRGLIERIEELDVKAKAISADKKIVFAEAKSNGFNTIIMKNMIKRRKMKPHDLEEHDNLMDLYGHALGMLPEPPLFRAVGQMAVDTKARESVIDALRQLVPQSGEIIVKIGDQPVRMTRDKDGNAVVTDYTEPRAASPYTGSDSNALRPKPEVPDVKKKNAKAYGAQFYRENKPVISNPFPADDPRRPLFDQGWREASGNDGMGDDD
ncbi:MAG: DUF2312 domain-containing protein [Rhizobiales bacterium]|nr:DUF2312 domain-containing protein [Hyphomicrobiales bacterium]